MIPENVSDCANLMLKLTLSMMVVFSTPSVKIVTVARKNTDKDDYVIRNIGIKLCQLRCAENGQCVSTEYSSEALTCRLTIVEPKKVQKKGGHDILARDHSHVTAGFCTSSRCSFSQRCLKTRSGKVVCAQDLKHNDPEESPQHKVHKPEIVANSQLHDACIRGDLYRVRFILFQGSVDINSRDEKRGRTPLMVAAQEGQCRIFEFLISKGANKSDVDNDGNNVLYWACKGGHPGMVECVLPQYGMVKNEILSPLLQAAKMGNRELFEFLECTGSNVSQNNNGWLALFYASRGGHMALVKYLVSQGNVDINRRNSIGTNALIGAANGGHTAVFKYLVCMGANASHVDYTGNNVLHHACMGGRLTMVKYLVSKVSVDIKSRRKDGKTPLMAAAFGGNTDVFKYLVSMGANMSRVDDNGNNVLHYACMSGHWDMVRYLVKECRLLINSSRKDGKTPFMIAAKHRHTSILTLLLHMGANASGVDKNGHAILHVAQIHHFKEPGPIFLKRS